MALAAFQLLKCTGTNAATETDTSKATTFLSADEHDPVAGNHPIQAPLDASDPDGLSYEMWLRLKCTSAPDNYVQNIKFFGPSTQPDDPTNKITVEAGTTDTGVTPVATASTVATVVQHTNYTTTANGLAIGVVPSGNQITAVNDYSDYLVLQLAVDFGATQGAGAEIVFNFSFEEA